MRHVCTLLLFPQLFESSAKPQGLFQNEPYPTCIVSVVAHAIRLFILIGRFAASLPGLRDTIFRMLLLIAPLHLSFALHLSAEFVPFSGQLHVCWRAGLHLLILKWTRCADPSGKDCVVDVLLLLVL